MGKREKRILRSIGAALAKVLLAVGAVFTPDVLSGTWNDLGQPRVVIPAIFAAMTTLWAIFGSSPAEEMRSSPE